MASAANFICLSIYYMLLGNVINNLASTLRHLGSRSLGDEIAKAYAKSCQISNMVLFAKIVKDFQSFIIFEKSFILNICHDFEYASEWCYCLARTCD